MTMKSAGAAVHIRRSGGIEFQILGAAKLKLPATNERESSLVFDQLERTSGMLSM